MTCDECGRDVPRGPGYDVTCAHVRADGTECVAGRASTFLTAALRKQVEVWEDDALWVPIANNDPRDEILDGCTCIECTFKRESLGMRA